MFRYLSDNFRDFAIRITRTLVPFIWGYLILLLGDYLGIRFTEDEAKTAMAGLEVVLGAIIYMGITVLAKKFPFLEYLLIFPTPPVYTTKETK